MDYNQPSAVTLFSNSSMECQIMDGKPRRQACRSTRKLGVSEAAAAVFVQALRRKLCDDPKLD
jgi:hypothetical protein